jgi:hypothetical protein
MLLLAITLFCATRLLSAGHGGQILLSLPSAELVRNHLLPRKVRGTGSGSVSIRRKIIAYSTTSRSETEAIWQKCAII